MKNSSKGPDTRKDKRSNKAQGQTRREFIKKVAYVAPAVTTLVVPSYVSAESICSEICCPGISIICKTQCGSPCKERCPPRCLPICKAFCKTFCLSECKSICINQCESRCNPRVICRRIC